MQQSLKLTIGLLAAGFAAGQISLTVQRVQSKRRDEAVAHALTGGDAQRGRPAALRYQCGACHEIPGVPRAAGQTGPSLSKVADRVFIAGRLSNNPTDLIRWIRAPQSINPGGGMPDLGVTEADGRDIAAYLYTLR
jgi:cytochrome c